MEQNNNNNNKEKQRQLRKANGKHGKVRGNQEKLGTTRETSEKGRNKV